ncbi:MAG: serine/threonine-protein kinase, partial [Gemmataceae bacterium]
MAQPSNQPGFGAEKVSPAARIVQFGKYRVHKHLATGGMGTVYRAVDTESHLEVALKILMPELNSRPGPRNRFLQESRSAARLNHENIVSVFDSGEANGLPFIAMEFIQGTDLHEEVKKRGPLDLAEARLIILQAARALDHAHSFGIIHRDIKPANILLRRINSQPLVKLVDFGLARDLEGEDLQMTRPGTTVGTVDFMAPEQACDSRAADIRSDLYS